MKKSIIFLAAAFAFVSNSAIAINNPNTPLMTAVIACNTAWTNDYKAQELDQTYARFKQILKADANQVNVQCGRDNMTPLMMAAHFGLVRIVSDLLTAGALVTTGDIHGKDAAWYAGNFCISKNPKSCTAVQTLLTPKPTHKK